MNEMTTIVRVAARGDGVSAEGRHFPLTAPGDVVAVDGTVTRGSHYNPPECSHYPACGGCQLQHLDTESFAGFVDDRVRHALSVQGVDIPVLTPVHLSPPYSRRRANLHAERRAGKVIIGFTEERSHRIVDLTDCAVLAPQLFALVAPLRKLLARMIVGRKPVSIRMTLADQGIDLVLGGVSADGLAIAEALSDFAAAHGIARLAVDDGYGAQTRWEPVPVTVTLGGIPVPLPHDAFLQATIDGEGALIAAVQTAIGDAKIVADLFAGLGTFALGIKPGGKTYAAEASRDAAAALTAAAGRAQRPIFVEHRDLYRRPLTVAELNRFEAVILDPPRAGAEEQVKAIAQSSVPRVAYVSCNPQSFARDARMLIAGGYALEIIKPVGQFLWSTHVELAAGFVRP